MSDFLLGVSVTPQWLWVAYAVLAGLCIGSFTNVLTWRLPRYESILGRSRCPRCLVAIRWYHNIPLVSYVALGARCRDCTGPISWRYPLVELASAALWGFTIAWFGLTLHGLAAAVFLSSLLLASLIDGEHMVIPDVVSVPAIVTGLVAAWMGWGPPFRNALFSAVVGGLLIALLVIVTRGGVGSGDVIIATALGANLGLAGLVLALWLCFLIGGAVATACLALGVRGRKDAIPYGPCLAAGGAIALFATPAFSEWLQRTFPIAMRL